MLTKSEIKLILSLEHKKFRNEYKLFVAEGPKTVNELLKQKWPVDRIFATKEWSELKNYPKTIIITGSELGKISFQKTPQHVLAVCKMADRKIDFNNLKNTLCLALDNVQDPGNVGTIIRLADWFGIGHIFSGTGTADLYNPKVIQATMGAFTRVSVHSVDLTNFLSDYKVKTMLPVFGTLLDGNNIYHEKLNSNGIIVMGSEGNGISEEIKLLLTHRLFIPSYPEGSHSSESLNVAISTAIICAEFRRKFSSKPVLY